MIRQHGWEEPSRVVAGDLAANYPGIARPDLRRLIRLYDNVRGLDTGTLLRQALGPGLSGAVLDSLAAHCVFDHGAVLVFPRQVDDVVELLRDLGGETGRVVPSVVVRGIIADRLGVSPERVPIQLVHASFNTPAAAPRGLEVFMLSGSNPLADKIIADEREFETQSHFALRVVDADFVSVLGLAAILQEFSDFVPDGGGFNPHEEAEYGGVGVLYFTARSPRITEIGMIRRLEVKFQGRWSEAVAAAVLERSHRPTGV